jgi:Cytochrome c7 and related cytochrome c
MLRRSPLAYLASNIISLIGVVLVTTASILWLLTFPAYWKGEASTPYIGIILFLLLPGVFLFGLLLIPVGIGLHTWKRRKAGDRGPFLPQSGELRRLAIFVGLTTMVNLLIGSQFSYRAVTYMDGDNFCGRACHKVMEPEYTAHSVSPHSNVACTDCHIGPGASSFVKAKLAGTHQAFGILFSTYPRPIPAPVQALRSAHETCEQCHSPKRFSGEKIFIHAEFASDEQNSAATTVALLKVGGPSYKGGIGIHGAHVQGADMRYIATDQRRQEIPQVTYTDKNGKVTVFNSTDAKVTPEELARGEHRDMDCLDCHNRPTHTFQVPERALDLAMSQGSISPKLPFIKKEAIEVLRRNYPDRDTGAREIAASIENFYRTSYPQTYGADSALIKSAISTVQSLYAQNIFPDMKITWGTYPNNLGHTDYPGCFRCHDGNHTSADGRTISNDCATCHDLLAVSEKNPKILTDLGMSPPTPLPIRDATK